MNTERVYIVTGNTFTEALAMARSVGMDHISQHISTSRIPARIALGGKPYWAVKFRAPTIH